MVVPLIFLSQTLQFYNTIVIMICSLYSIIASEALYLYSIIQALPRPNPTFPDMAAGNYNSYM